MPTELETLIVERRDGVVTVTMNRPARKNAANGTMWHELLSTFDEVARDRHDRVMVLTGAGDAFCSGADLGNAADVAGRPGDPYLVQMRALGDVALRFEPAGIRQALRGLVTEDCRGRGCVQGQL